MGKMIVFFKSVGGGEGALKNSGKLHLDQAKHRWVKNYQGDPPEKQHAGRPLDAQKEVSKPEDSAHGYGTHNVDVGDHLAFKAGEAEASGQIVAKGKDGATVKDSTGREHQVHWHEVTDFKAGKGTQKPDDGRKVLGPRDPVPADQFNAAEWSKAHDDADVTPESIIAQFPDDTKDKIAEAIQRLKSVEETHKQHSDGKGKYSAEREKRHEDIFFNGVEGPEWDEGTGERKTVRYPGLFDAEKVKAATPPAGQSPTFTILGGRGGSGKSQFKGMVYDPDKCIVLDADHIKHMLPEFDGWNAHQVHEESSDILENALAYAREKGLNVVLDATMKTAKSALAKVEAFKGAGYRTEAHYMHLPRQEAAKRAVARFLGKTKRFVPPEIVLGNTTNEASFDQIKGKVDAWSLRDNNVKKGEKPVLISQNGDKSQSSGNAQEDKGKEMTKSLRRPTILVWRIK